MGVSGTGRQMRSEREGGTVIGGLGRRNRGMKCCGRTPQGQHSVLTKRIYKTLGKYACKPTVQSTAAQAAAIHNGSSNKLHKKYCLKATAVIQ